MFQGKRKLWWIALLLLLLVAWWQRSTIRTVLRWVEKRYFAYIADNGPLIYVQRGRWDMIQQGLWVRSIVYKRKHHWSKIRLFLVRMDPKYMQLKVWWGKPKRIRWIMRNTPALAAINGGPFDPSYRPWGQFKQAGRLFQKHLFRRDSDGVFYIRSNRIGIATAQGWKHKGSTTVFQSSPLLVVRGQRARLSRSKWRVDRRSALCIDQKGRLLMMTTDGLFNGLSYYELSLLMAAPSKRGGFHCKWGLNLDGGSSSQWAVRQKKQMTVISGIEKTPLYLLILPRRYHNHVPSIEK